MNETVLLNVLMNVTWVSNLVTALVASGLRDKEFKPKDCQSQESNKKPTILSRIQKS